MVDSLIILSDIHGNLSALEAVIEDFELRGYKPDAIAVLGDIINYGMRPNEVIERLRLLSEKYEIIVNLFGNHEKALIDGDTSNFSTDRGRRILEYTRHILIEESMQYLNLLIYEGYTKLELNGKNFLFVHGSIQDPYWGKLDNDSAKDLLYSRYDFVVSGHSHIPHLMEQFYPTENQEYRNKKRTVFLNPGSVGQPRNHNPKAQYLYMEVESEVFHFNSVEYDVVEEQSLFIEDIDQFYKTRLKNGI